MSSEENSGRRLEYKKLPFQCNLNVRNISFSCDGSFILIACKNFIRQIYFKNFYGIVDYKHNINNTLCQNISMMELYPFTDKRFKIIAAYENTKHLNIFNIFNITKPGKKSEIKTIPLNYKCLFIQWNNKINNSFLTASNDKKIYVYVNNQKIHTINDDDFIKSMRFLLIEKYECYILITGYDKKVKIWDFNRRIFPEKYSQIISLKDEIDIIDKSIDGLYIIFGSKKSKTVYIYQFIFCNGEYRYDYFLHIDPINNVGEMINANFINNAGFVITYQFSFFYYYISNNKDDNIKEYSNEKNENNKAILDVKYVTDKKINFASIMLRKLTSQNFLIYSGENFLETQEIIVKNISSNHINKLAIKKHSEKILTIVNTIKNRKIAIEPKIENCLYHLKIKNNIIEIKFNDLTLKPKISVIEYHDSNLYEILLNEIEIFKNKNYDLDDNENILINFLYKLNDIIVDYQTDQEESTDENSEIFNITQKEINAFKIFRDWEKTSEKKIPINHLFNEKLENQFINLVSSNIRDVVNWNFNFEQDINVYFNFINRNSNEYTSIQLFPCTNNDRKQSINSNNKYMLSDNIKFKDNSNLNLEIKNENNENKKKQSSCNCDLNDENDNKDSSSSKSKSVSKNRQELFYKYVSQIKEKKDQKENISFLKDILKQINFYLMQLINEKTKVLKELFRDNILNTILILEQQSKFEFLFICLIPLSNIIFQEIIKEKNKNNNKINEEQIFQDDSSSEKSISDHLEYEIVEENNKIERSISKRNSIHTQNNKILDEEVLTNQMPSHKRVKSSNIFFENNKSSFSSQAEKVDSKKLIKFLGNKFVKTIVNFISFFSEELYLVSNNAENKDVLKFLYLINQYYENQEIKEEINKINNMATDDI